MEKTGWKATAIILGIILILGILLFVWVWSIGTTMIENENICSINICNGYETYYYDDLDKICYCYNNHEVFYQEYIGG